MIIENIAKDRSKVRLLLDDGQKVWLTAKALREGGFAEGQEVERDAFERFVLLRQYPPALNRAVALLAGRACSRGEIQRKLLQARYAERTVRAVLRKLENEGLLNDLEFARQWAAYRSGMKMGQRRIAQELRSKGVSQEHIQLALQNLREEDELDQAIALAKKHAHRLAGDEIPLPKARQRISAALARRGFDWDTARQACDAVLQEEEE